jgi:hypothetical protein
MIPANRSTETLVDDSEILTGDMAPHRLLSLCRKDTGKIPAGLSLASSRHGVDLATNAWSSIKPAFSRTTVATGNGLTGWNLD